MSSTVRISSDMIKPFKGEGDVISWIKKVQLVAKLQKITDLASFLPLYLEGDALALYLEMGDQDQADAAKIGARLKEAFSMGPFVAHSRLAGTKWVGEQVDVYANEIRRLAGLAGFSGDGLEQIVKLTFVNGFPDSISIALQTLPKVESMTMSDLITRARVLASKKTSDVTAVAGQGGYTVGTRARVAHPAEAIGGKGEPRGFKGKCYRCNGAHMIRDCKEPKPPIICFKCNGSGHIASQCDQGNDWRGATAPAATPSV